MRIQIKLELLGHRDQPLKRLSLMVYYTRCPRSIIGKLLRYLLEKVFPLPIELGSYNRRGPRVRPVLTEQLMGS